MYHKNKEDKFEFLNTKTLCTSNTQLYTTMNIQEIFNALSAGLKADPSVVKRVGAVFQFDIDVGGSTKSYVVDLKNGNGEIREGTTQADCTIGVSENDFKDLMTGKANGQQLFMSGKLKLKGNMVRTAF